MPRLKAPQKRQKCVSYTLVTTKVDQTDKIPEVQRTTKDRRRNMRYILTSCFFPGFCRGLVTGVLIELHLRRLSGRSSDWNAVLLLKEIKMSRSVARPDLYRFFVWETRFCPANTAVPWLIIHRNLTAALKAKTKIMPSIARPMEIACYEG